MLTGDFNERLVLTIVSPSARGMESKCDVFPHLNSQLQSSQHNTVVHLSS